MKKLLGFLLVLISTATFAQTYVQVGNTMQRAPTAQGYIYRTSLGAPGFANWRTKEQIDSLLNFKLNKADSVNVANNYVTYDKLRYGVVSLYNKTFPTVPTANNMPLRWQDSAIYQKPYWQRASNRLSPVTATDTVTWSLAKGTKLTIGSYTSPLWADPIRQFVITAPGPLDTDISAMYMHNNKANILYTTSAHGNNDLGGVNSSWFYQGGYTPGLSGFDFNRVTYFSDGTTLGTGFDQVMNLVGNAGGANYNATHLLRGGMYWSKYHIDVNVDRFNPSTMSHYAHVDTSGAFFAKSFSGNDGTQGLVLGAYSLGAGFGAIYPYGVTPSNLNYVFASNPSSQTIINNPVLSALAVGGGNIVEATLTRTDIQNTTHVNADLYVQGLTGGSAGNFVVNGGSGLLRTRTAAQVLSDIGAQAAGNYLVAGNNLSDLTNGATARANLGGTTAGQNFFTLTNPSAITFPRINADNTVSALDAATFRTAIGAGTGGGSVTSVAMSAPTGFAVTGSPITTSGTLALSFASGYSLPSDATQATWTAKQTALGYTPVNKAGDTMTGDLTIVKNTAALGLDGTNGQAYTLLSNNGASDWVYGTRIGAANQNFSIYNYGTSTKAIDIEKATNNVTITGSLNSAAPQTIVAGSTSGSMVCSMPFQGSSYKKVIIYVNAMTGTAVYTFPTAFSVTPLTIYGLGLTPSTVSTTSATVDTGGVPITGWLSIEGY